MEEHTTGKPFVSRATESKGLFAFMVRRHGDLYEKFIRLDNFINAFHKAKKGRRFNKHVRKILGTQRKNETRKEYEKRREKRIKRFMQHLIYIVDSGKFTTSEYMTRDIKDPKPRTLYILPLYPDRIVQHALVNVLKPIWDKMFIHNSYACREGKGQHRCSKKISEYVKRYKYCALTDISKFYPSMPHDELYAVVQRKIKDKRILALLKDIIYSIEGDRNTPIGNLLSQHLGNLYLNEADQFEAHVLKLKAVNRYMDDKAHFSNNLPELKEKIEQFETFLSENLKLKLSKKKFLRCDNGVPFIGYRHFPNYVLLKKRTAKRIRKKVAKLDRLLEEKKITLIQYTSTLGAFYGWAKHANTYNFRKRIGLDEKFENARKRIKEVKMRGFPKYTDIATKYDVENLKAIFPNETKKFLESLRDDRFVWVTVSPLASKEIGVTDDTHRVIESMDQDNPETILYYQQELIEDEHARLFRMGYTVEQVNTLIESLS